MLNLGFQSVNWEFIMADVCQQIIYCITIDFANKIFIDMDCYASTPTYAMKNINSGTACT